MRLVPLAALALIAGTSAAAPRQSGPGAMVRFMSGDCDQLTLSGRSSAPCKPRLVNLVYASGAVSFVFTSADGGLLSFRSRIDRQVGMQTLLRVDQVTMIRRGAGSFDVRPARGSCTLTPFAVDRSRLECSARSGSSRFVGLFRTSDEAPRLLTLAGD